MDSPFSWEMLWSKQQLMKYLPLSCMCVQLGIPSRMTPAHPLMGTRMHIKRRVRPKMLWVSLHLDSEPTEKHKGALGVGALCCWMSHTVADIHIDEKKKKISRTQNIIVTFLLQMAGNKEPFWNISVSFSCCCCFLEWRHYDPLLCLIHCYSVCGSGTYKTRIPKSWDAV